MAGRTVEGVLGNRPATVSSTPASLIRERIEFAIDPVTFNQLSRHSKSPELIAAREKAIAIMYTELRWSLTHMAAFIGVSPATVKRFTAKMIAEGRLERQTQKGGSK